MLNKAVAGSAVLFYGSGVVCFVLTLAASAIVVIADHIQLLRVSFECKKTPHVVMTNKCEQLLSAHTAVTSVFRNLGCTFAAIVLWLAR